MEDRTKLFAVASRLAFPLAVNIVTFFFCLNQFYANQRYPFVLLFLLLLLPIMNYKLVQVYRNRITGGFISFAHAWSFVVMLNVFAGLLVAFCMYLYTAFVNPDYPQWILTTAIQYMEENQVQSEGKESLFIAENIKLLKAASVPSPIGLALQLFWTIFNLSCLVAIPIALLVKRRPKTNN